MELYCNSIEQTKKLGEMLGELSKTGDVFCFSGDLGAGKTMVCTEIAAAKGVTSEDINSPTFSIMNIYQGDLEIRHFDLYRLNTVEELEDIGYEEYIGGEGITLVEWADNFLEQMPNERLDVKIEVVGGGRKISLLPTGKRYEDICKEVEKNANFSD